MARNVDEARQQITHMLDDTPATNEEEIAPSGLVEKPTFSDDRGKGGTISSRRNKANP